MPFRLKSFAKYLVAASLLASLGFTAADARRGGSFGSRGSRTYYAPSPTRLSPGYVPPVSRSMSEPTSYGSRSYVPSYQTTYPSAARPGLFHGFGGGLLTGLVAGGLIGHFFGPHYGMGYGAGPGGGLLASIFQLALLGGLIWLAFRLFSGRSAGPASAPYSKRTSFAAMPTATGYGASDGDEIAIGNADQEAFERLLIELQDAYGQEDYGRLRAITTPEVMSYLAEELSDNATHGRRNEVRATRLLDGEVSEAWSEQGSDYATIVMRYESIDLMRDRSTGNLIQGDPREPSETTELWTFIRPSGAWSGWKVSAIQDG